MAHDAAAAEVVLVAAAAADRLIRVGARQVRIGGGPDGRTALPAEAAVGGHDRVIAAEVSAERVRRPGAGTDGRRGVGAPGDAAVLLAQAARVAPLVRRDRDDVVLEAEIDLRLREW